MADWTIVIEGNGEVESKTSKDITNLLNQFLANLKMADQEVEHVTITYANRDML